MKYLRYMTIGLTLLATMTSCEKDTENVSKEVKVSYPEITLNGSDFVALAVGAAYTDAGAKLKDDITGAVTDIQPTSNNVNTAAAGLYVVNFLAANENGFEASASRRVGVSSVTGSPDRTGTYLRAATGQTVKIAKVSNGVYRVQNPGGAASAEGVVVYFVETAPNTFVSPAQPTSVGTMAVNTIVFDATGASWYIANAGYGTQQRFFIKQ